MLRAYFDDSIHNARAGIAGGVYVLSGYVGDATRWAAFSDDWDDVLHEGPRSLDYLKTFQAYRLDDPKSMFYGWSPQERDGKLLRLATTVNRFARYSIQSAVRPEQYRDGLGVLTGARVYHFLFYSIIAGLVRTLERIGINDKIDIYFDEKGDESIRALHEGFAEFIKDAPLHLKERLGGRPEFKNDMDIKPQQAADLIAWHFRRNIFEHDRGRVFESPIWTELLNLERMTRIWTGKDMATMAERKTESARQPLQTDIMTLPDPSSGWGNPWK